MHFKAVFCTGKHQDIVRSLQKFRKTVLVDREGWSLDVEGDREVDAYDTLDATHLALYREGEICATFRATRTDRPYLAADAFPQLALREPFPHDRTVWEVSRFCVDVRDRRSVSTVNYGVMLWWATHIHARSLVAVTEIAHERLLATLGIVTRRYGSTGVVGIDLRGRPLRAVAGEISLADQSPAALARLFAHLNDVEFVDVSNVFGSSRLSA